MTGVGYPNEASAPSCMSGIHFISGQVRDLSDGPDKQREDAVARAYPRPSGAIPGWASIWVKSPHDASGDESCAVQLLRPCRSKIR